MRPLVEWPLASRRAIRIVLTDIDGTLTDDGRLGAPAYGALSGLDSAGIAVIPVTGRPAGWCDQIARIWPVAGVVGENGAFYFRHDRDARRMLARYWQSEEARAADRHRLDRLRSKILDAVPGAALASDQPYRVADLAIDFAEDVGPLDDPAIDRIVALFEAEGAQAKVSSIHVNGWFGSYDKLSMSRALLREQFDVDIDLENAAVAFIGDSANDAPLFKAFENAVGVANVRDHLARIADPPAWLCAAAGGAGFVEFADALLQARAA